MAPSVDENASGAARRRSRRVRAAACALALAGACNVPRAREGVWTSFEPPGPNPTNVSGIETNVPAATEDNIVEVARIAGRVQVRLAGERGPRDLMYFRPRIQTSPFGVVLLGPHAIARMSFPDDSWVVATDTALIRFGDPARGEPRVICGRLTNLSIVVSATPTIGPVELPGGARLTAPAGSHVQVVLYRDRFYRVRNESNLPITIALAGRDYPIGPADDAIVPVILNEPEVPQAPSIVEAWTRGSR